MAGKVYVDEVEDTTVYNINVNWVMNAISSANFQIPDIHIDGTHTVRDTWKALVDIATIRIEYDGITKFIGTIKKLTGDRQLTIHCLSSLSKFKWYDIKADAAYFKLWEGNADGPAAGTSVDCEDAEGNNAAFVIDEHIGNYLVVSDATTNTENDDIEWNNGTDVIVGRSGTEDFDEGEVNSYADVKVSDDVDKWEGVFYNDEVITKRAILELQLENYTIPITAKIPKLSFSCAFSITPNLSNVTSLFKGKKGKVKIMLGKDE